MADEVTSLRVSIYTRQRLREAIRRLAQWCETAGDKDMRDNVDNKNPACEEISMDRFLNHLLDQREGKRERERRYKRGRAGRRKPSRQAVENAGGGQ